MTLWDRFINALRRLSASAQSRWGGRLRPCRRTTPRRNNRLLEVEILEDRTVPALIVTTIADSAVGQEDIAGSLRQRINQANSDVAVDTIQFNLLDGNTINLKRDLPLITRPVIIDAGVQLVWVKPEVAGTVNNGLVFQQGASSSKVLNLRVYGFTQDGFRIENANFIELKDVKAFKNGVGVHITGSQAHDNTLVGSWIAAFVDVNDRNEKGVVIADGAHHNAIGSLGPNGVNTISGNKEIGVLIENADHNTVAGNIIGLNSDGTTSMGEFEQKYGVVLSGTSSNNRIGGSITVAGGIVTPANVISGNKLAGVQILGTGTLNRLEGNL